MTRGVLRYDKSTTQGVAYLMILVKLSIFLRTDNTLWFHGLAKLVTFGEPVLFQKV